MSIEDVLPFLQRCGLSPNATIYQSIFKAAIEREGIDMNDNMSDSDCLQTIAPLILKLVSKKTIDEYSECGNRVSVPAIKKQTRKLDDNYEHNVSRQRYGNNYGPPNKPNLEQSRQNVISMFFGQLKLII